MAGVIAQQGDIPRALELWNQSLEILDRIGDVKGKAATLANMAWAAGKQGDYVRGRELNLQAAVALAQIGAWLDCITVLGNLGATEDSESSAFLAQALWLALRVHLPVDDSVYLAAALFQKVPTGSDAEPLLATWAMFLTQTRGENHPKKEELQRLALGMLVAAAQAHSVTEDGIKEWMAGKKLNDPNYVVPALSKALEELVPDNAWLFDRSQFKARES